jgi:hypothetical protein
VDGWDDDSQECDWCKGIGYVYRDEHAVNRPIPPTELAALADTLEALEVLRLRELGYTGQAKKPWEQAVRQARGKLPNGNS